MCLNSGCGKGHYIDTDSNECTLCPIGTYSTTENAESCTACPEEQTTSQEGSTINLQCYFGG